MSADRSPDEAADAPALSFIVAAHNSADVIENTLEALAKRLTDTTAEIVVVENGSTDRTREVLADIAQGWPASAVPLRVVQAERGLGHAVRTGIARSTGSWLVITADDLPFGFDDLDGAERLGYPARTLLIGSKGHPESVVDRSLARTVFSTGLRVLRLVTIGLRTADPQGSLIVDGDWARRVAPALVEPGFLISTEIVYAASVGGVTIVELPVRLRESTHRTRIRAADIYRMGVGLVNLRGRRRTLVAASRPATPTAPTGSTQPSMQ